MKNYKHWEKEIDAENIVWLGLSRADSSTNSISSEVLDELNSILQELAKESNLAGLVLYSLKEKGFVAGADVKEFSQYKTKSEVVDFLHKGQAVFTRLEELAIPTVAMIHGFCMGGGLELALACDYRIASDDLDTRIGLPEVLLGIHPGWGGTVRLTRLIGGFSALGSVILPGSALASYKAKKLGIIDESLPLRQLKRAASHYILTKPAKHKPSFLQSLSNYSLMRPIFSSLMRYKLAQRISKAHYPAPFAALDLWEKEGGMGERAYIKEIDSIEKLITQNETASNLIRVFLLRERLKSFAKDSNFKAKHVHVIGAGIMGGDIAAWCAFKGLKVTLQDVSYEKIAPAIARAHSFFKKKLKDHFVQAAMDNLVADPNGYGLSKAEVVIEAVFENLAVKQTILKEVEAKAKEDTLIATNTSSIPLEELAEVMKDKSRLVGIHFFNPVKLMELIEVGSSQFTSKTVEANACAFVGQIGRLPLPVTSNPGFLVNRVLMPYLLECVQLIEEGYSGEQIDQAAEQFGMMMGPVELADTVGMDVCLAVAENLTQHFGGSVPQKLKDMVAAGKLGRKTGEGFYRYKAGKPIKKSLKEDNVSKDLANRLILRMVNESSVCLREKVVADADLLDAGMIFAAGFAPFRGGPMNYAKQVGQDKLSELVKSLEIQHGQRFKVDASLID